jgi:HEAT repeat protein
MTDARDETAIVREARQRLQDPNEEVRRAAVTQLPPEWLPGAVSFLVEALGDPSWRVRKEAAARLSRWPDPAGAVPALIASLCDTNNVGLRNAAVEALAAIGRPAVAALLTALAAGGDHRKLIIDALAVIRDPQAVEPLCTALEDPDENIRAAAAEALGGLGGPRVGAALRAELARGGLLSRLAALEALVHMGEQVPLAELRPALEQPILRRAGVLALGRSGDPEGLPYLLDALSDPGRGVREAAGSALTALHESLGAPGKRGIEQAVRASANEHAPALLGLLESVDAATRRAAATLLGWSRAPTALRALARELADDEVHDAAAQAIVQYGPAAVTPLVELAREAEPALRPTLYDLFPQLGAAAADPRVSALLATATDDGDLEEATAAARALGELGGKDALAPLFHAVASPQPELQNAATGALSRLGTRYPDEVRMLCATRGLHGETAPQLCRVLGAIGASADRPVILGALKDESAELRRAAAEALAAMGPDPDAVSALLLALADESAAVRAAAARALGQLADVTATSAVLGATTDPDPQVRQAAVRALGQLADPRAQGTLRELALHPDGAVAAHAIEALQRTLGRVDPSILAAGLGHADAEVVKAALRALTHLPGADALHGLLRVLNHARWDVRKLAAEALGERRDGVARPGLRARRAIESDELVIAAIEQALADLSAACGPGESAP